MIIPIAQLQMATLAAPALLALLLLPGVTLSHPALIAQSIAGSAICAAADAPARRDLFQADRCAAAHCAAVATSIEPVAQQSRIVRRPVASLALAVAAAGSVLSCRAP